MRIIISTAFEKVDFTYGIKLAQPAIDTWGDDVVIP